MSQCSPSTGRTRLISHRPLLRSRRIIPEGMEAASYIRGADHFYRFRWIHFNHEQIGLAYDGAFSLCSKEAWLTPSRQVTPSACEAPSTPTVRCSTCRPPTAGYRPDPSTDMNDVNALATQRYNITNPRHLEFAYSILHPGRTHGSYKGGKTSQRQGAAILQPLQEQKVGPLLMCGASLARLADTTQTALRQTATVHLLLI